MYVYARGLTIYVGVGILVTCGKHSHGSIISLRGEVWGIKGSLRPPPFIVGSVPS